MTDRDHLLLALTLGLCFISPPCLAQPDRITGQELAAQLRSLTPDKPATLHAELEVKRNRKITLTPITTRILISAGSWETVYQASTPGQTEQLTIVSRSRQPNEYSYANSTPSSPCEPRPLSQSELNASFAGSDFWPFDLGREFLHWPHQTILKSQMRKSRSCKVLESKPDKDSDHPYSRVVSWIDNETGGVVIAEAYDRQGKLLKEFETRNVRKINGEYQVDLQIWNVQTDSRTRLNFHEEQ